jgi:hypothetical protein
MSSKVSEESPQLITKFYSFQITKLVKLDAMCIFEKITGYLNIIYIVSGSKCYGIFPAFA